jgi:hypothetical protein
MQIYKALPQHWDTNNNLRKNGIIECDHVSDTNLWQTPNMPSIWSINAICLTCSNFVHELHPIW